MAKLRIKYEPQQRAAILSAEGNASFWANILRACSDHSTQVVPQGALSLSMPWWQFLSCREAVGYHVAQNNADVEFEPAAEALLERAERKILSLEEQQRPAIPVSKLQGLLIKRGFTRCLTPEQARNVSSLSGVPAGATFSVPGAGKTAEALALFFLKASPNTRLLVVAPKNAFAAWERELSLCVPTETAKFYRLAGGESRIRAILNNDPAPKFMLVTYHQFQYARDEIAAKLTDDTWMFLDESHRIKRGLGGRIGSTILSVSHAPDFKLLLSGTPMPNSEDDLIPQFEFLFPEIGVFENDVTSLIQPYYVRTTKNELGLRPPERRLIPVPMTETQTKLYKLARSEIARQADRHTDFDAGSGMRSRSSRKPCRCRRSRMERAARRGGRKMMAPKKLKARKRGT